MSKPFNTLTDPEAHELIRDLIKASSSEEDLKRRLKEAGFGDSAGIVSTTFGQSGEFFTATVNVMGPNGNMIWVL